MDLGTFRSMLAAYLGRDSGTFMVNGVNLLDRAINQARKSAERQHRFECARDSVKLENVSLSDGAPLAAATSLYDPGRLVRIRTIERAFLGYSNGVGQFQIEVLSRDADMRELHRSAIKQQANDATLEYPGPVGGTYRLVRHGAKVYISPYDSSATSTARTVFMDVVLWLPDYVKYSDTDFFLEHCEDYMLMRAVYQLNFMLKEDQRVVISEKAMDKAWETVLKADNDAVSGSADDATLD